ncbi:MAG: hypothetical protein B0D91_14515 [Oceanospirillales bacterium LUC14_002_19_P2]|nr:MAG: hypothetical protein B0D91_14515 [Oceanospirillales bacterium LUC14_002_19_P2]
MFVIWHYAIRFLIPLLLTVAGQIYAATNDQTDNALPILRFSDNQWFELSITSQSRPETAFDIEDEQNRERMKDRQENEKGRDSVFPDELDFMNELRLRYQLRFK